MKARWWESTRNLGFAGTVVATVVGGFLLNRFELVPLARWLSTISRWLMVPVRVPLILLLIALVLLGLFVIRWIAHQAPPRPAWLSYQQDSFLGVIWRWKYNGSQLDQPSIGAFCPTCDMRLRPESQGYRSFTTTLSCESCGFHTEVDGNGPDVINQVARLIEREANKRIVQA